MGLFRHAWLDSELNGGNMVGMVFCYGHQNGEVQLPSAGVL